jgi:hypothetical protein
MKKIVITSLQKTKLFFAASTLFMLGIILLYVGMSTLIEKKTAAYTEMFTKTQTQTDAFYALSTQKKVVSGTVEKRDQLTSYFINQGSVGSFFEKLEEIADNTNVDFSVISARLGQVGAEGLRVQISADGTFRNVYHFLTLVETMPFGINITTLDMHTNIVGDTTETGQSWRGVFGLEVITYVE